MTDSNNKGVEKNIPIHGVAEKINSNKDDGDEVVANIDAELGIDINECDIQRAHRLGKKKKSPARKLRQIIARFISYKSETIYCMQKKNLKASKNYPKAFLTENLTPLRSKLLNYVKYECNDKFVGSTTFQHGAFRHHYSVLFTNTNPKPLP